MASHRPTRRIRLAAMILTTAAATAAGGSAPAGAATSTRHGTLTITPAVTSVVFDRNPLAIPYLATTPCQTTDYGGGVSGTYCDGATVALVHPSNPANVSTDLVFPTEDGTESGNLSVYGYMLKGFGKHTLRITDSQTGETASTIINMKALTRTGATFTRTKKAPAAATLRVSATLTAFDGYEFTKLATRAPIVLQTKTGSTWSGVRTAWTTNGSASWSLRVTGKATYRVCHAADAQSTASCTGAKTL